MSGMEVQGIILVPALFFAIVIASWLLGLRALSLLNLGPLRRLQRSSLSAALGLGIFGFFILIIGLFKALYSWAILTFLLIVIVTNAANIGTVFKEILYFIRRLAHIFKSGAIESVLIALIIIGILAALAGVIAPATGQDAMVYHLSDAKYFAWHNRIENVPFSSNSLYPYLVEMYLTAGLTLGSEVLAKLFNLIFAFLIISMSYSVARRYLPVRNSLLTAAVGFLSPGVIALVGYAYVEIGLAVFTLAVFICFLQLLKTDRLHWALLAGMFQGFCISIKIFGIVTFAILAVFILFFYWRKKSLGTGIRACFIFGVVSMAIGCIWYIRSAIVWHNPFYPFYFKYIGETGWYIPKLTCPVGVALNIRNLLAIPWLLTMYPDPFGGGANQLSPLFLLLLPLVIFKFYKNKEIRYVTSSLLLFTVSWFIIYQNIRHLTPYAPLFAVVSIYAYSISFNSAARFKRALQSLIILALVYEAALGIYYYKDAILLCMGMKTRAGYAIDHDRSAEAAFYMKKHLPPDTRVLLVDELRNYRFDNDVVREAYYWRYTGYDRKARSSAEVVRALRHDNFGYILMRKSLLDREAASAARKKNPLRLTELLADDEFKREYLALVRTFEYRGSDPNHYCRYYLYKIK